MHALRDWWSRRVTRTGDPAWRLYRAAAGPAVRPERLALLGLDDTPEHRFEALALHLAAAWTRLGAGGTDVQALRQGLGDAFVADMDASLRDLGAGDLGVGRRVKALAERLYGRFAAYGPAFAIDAPAAAVDDALMRNLYKGGSPADAAAPARARLALSGLAAAWAELDDSDILAGNAPTL